MRIQLGKRSSRFYADDAQIMKPFIEYWIDLIDDELHCFTDKEQVTMLVNKLQDAEELKVLTIENSGVFAYCFCPDFRGNKSLTEIIFYIRPENRGNIRLVKKYIDKIESIAKENNCVSVKIGANIGYNDAGFIKLLRHFGYLDDTLVKYI
jgi:hypothetical protein